MKRETCEILMVVWIAAMVLLPVVPCNATWTYLGSWLSGGAPDSDWDQERGDNYWWYWSYDAMRMHLPRANSILTNYDRNGKIPMYRLFDEGRLL